MGSKEIKIKFTKEQIEKYNTQGFKLCFSAGVGAEPAFNVVAYADTIAGNVTISWVDRFKIAATKDKFSNGVKFNISTNPTGIKFGEVYTLPATWVDGTISSEKLPENSFKFLNDTASEASAVIFKTINGKDLPFYISSSPVDSKGNEVMSPKSIVALWFQKNAETGTMVSVIKGDLSIFDFSARDGIDLRWDGAHFVEPK